MASAEVITQTACLPGTYQPNSGADSCLRADPGFFVASAEAITQTACEPGSYQPNSGATACMSAPIGFYLDQTGANEATACPAGTSTEAEASTSSNDCLTDTDGDGQPDTIDTDDDNDGIPDAEDPNPKSDGPVVGDGHIHLTEYRGGTQKLGLTFTNVAGADGLEIYTQRVPSVAGQVLEVYASVDENENWSNKSPVPLLFFNDALGVITRGGDNKALDTAWGGRERLAMTLPQELTDIGVLFYKAELYIKGSGSVEIRGSANGRFSHRCLKWGKGGKRPLIGERCVPAKIGCQMRCACCSYHTNGEKGVLGVKGRKRTLRPIRNIITAIRLIIAVIMLRNQLNVGFRPFTKKTPISISNP